MTNISPEAALEHAEAEREAWKNAPKLRLLYCMNCHTLEELPDYQGNSDNDTFLERALEKHTDASGTPHTGRLMDVPVALWNNVKVREQITKQIYDELSPGLNALVPGYYDVKNQYSADALRCYVQHNKPADGNCSDWHARSKEIVADTKNERKDLGLAAPGTEGPKTYLCSFCPVAIVRQQKAFDRAGV